MPRATAKEHSSYKVGFFFCLWLRPAGLSREVNYPKAYPRQLKGQEGMKQEGIKRGPRYPLRGVPTLLWQKLPLDRGRLRCGWF
jgi:hypothetical protein